MYNSYGVLAGNVSSQSMLFAKSGVELVILTVVSDKNQLQYPLTWILLTMMVLTAILQVKNNSFIFYHHN
jgi:cytochrome oxidase assembly protein ShyY1